MSDILQAVVLDLRDDSAIDAIVSGRVFGTKLPANEDSSMPRACLVVSAGGIAPSGHNGGYAELARERFDIRCYGATPILARQLGTAVALYMKRLTPHNVTTTDGDVRLYNATPSSGGIALVEPDSGWDFWYASYGVLASMAETPATPDLLVVVGG